jgi:hypothetical protein
MMGAVLTGGAKLAAIDLSSNQLIKTIPIGPDAISLE